MAGADGLWLDPFSAPLSAETTAKGKRNLTQNMVQEFGAGQGLRLSFAKEVIEGHNGYIEFQTKKGKGTTFYVYLPVLC
jgi:signal transduction histidine kinase